MNDQTIGTCSICGGPVTVPGIWMGVTPPIPTCQRCGAVRATHGPVIEMTHRGSHTTKLPTGTRNDEG